MSYHRSLRILKVLIVQISISAAEVIQSIFIIKFLRQVKITDFSIKYDGTYDDVRGTNTRKSCAERTHSMSKERMLKMD